jgi:UDP-N-acetylglucosamine:LPS N-acetylglucosamine transferase
MTYNAKVYAAAEYAATIEDANKTQSALSRNSKRVDSKQGTSQPKKKLSKKMSKRFTSTALSIKADDKDHNLEESPEKPSATKKSAREKSK